MALSAVQVNALSVLLSLCGIGLIIYFSTAAPSSVVTLPSVPPGGVKHTAYGGVLVVEKQLQEFHAIKGDNMLKKVHAQSIAEFTGLTTGWVPSSTGKAPVFWSLLKAEKPRLVYSHNIISSEAAEALIGYASKKIERSSVINTNRKEGSEVNPVRTSSGMFVTEDANSWFNMELRNNAAKIAGVPPNFMEATQVLQYKAGQFYKPHSDYFDLDDRVNMDRGGQRIATMLTWLNDVPQGGGTTFPNAGIIVNPKKGDSVMFYDVDAEGQEDPFSIHGGVPPEGDSVKWVAVLWMHPREFR